MADIEMVIKIPEEIYSHLLSRYKYQNIDDIGLSELDKVGVAIKNGTLLPKGHGDLKDTEKLKESFIVWSTAVNGNFTDADIATIIYNSPTIIDADKESKE